MSATKTNNTAAATGRITGAHGRHYVVELPDAQLLHCFPRGKKSNYACGDVVDVERSGSGQGSITNLHPRKSLLYRSDRFREKIIAANITQAVIVVAARPAFNEDLMMRCLVACEEQGIKAIIVLNKTDLIEESAAAREQLRLFQSLGYPVVELCAKQDVSPLLPLLGGHSSVVVGQSGMGKSTIINALVPDAQARTAEISEALDSGRHTTTSAQLYHLDHAGDIIDSPGLQTFGVLHVGRDNLARSFQEFLPLLGHCRFDDCRHVVEPGCAIIAAVERGEIDPRRWNVYKSLLQELESKPPEWA